MPYREVNVQEEFSSNSDGKKLFALSILGVIALASLMTFFARFNRDPNALRIHCAQLSQAAQLEGTSPEDARAQYRRCMQ